MIDLSTVCLLKSTAFFFYLVPNFETLWFFFISRYTVSHFSLRVRSKYNQSAFTSVVPLSSQRAEEFIQRPSSTRIWQPVKFLFYNCLLEEGSRESHEDVAGGVIGRN